MRRASLIVMLALFAGSWSHDAWCRPWLLPEALTAGSGEQSGERPPPADANSSEALPAGAQCADPPSFSFRRLDARVYELTAVAEEEHPYVVTVHYLDGAQGGGGKPIQVLGRTEPCHVCCGAAPPGGCCCGPRGRSLCENARKNDSETPCGPCPKKTSSQPNGTTFCILATEEGTSVNLSLDPRLVLRAGGFVQVGYAGQHTVPQGCTSSRQGVVSLKAMQKHRLRLDAGLVYKLDGGGSWTSEPEVALTTRSDWGTWFRGGVDLRYSALGADGGTEGDGGNGNGEGNGGGESQQGGESGNGGDGDGGQDDFNPFEAGGGVFEVNVYGLFRLPRWPWVGLAGGAGFSTVPGLEGSGLEVRSRYFAALETAVQGYNAGGPAKSLADTSGFARLGWLWDDLYQDVVLEPAAADGNSEAETGDESQRYFLEGELEIPRIGTQAVRLVLRFFASIPRSGDGPSDVRVSALIDVDIENWFPGLLNDGS